ncbi:hypothetical protein LBMAG52_36790 [Planctomycetia bacterium]|nr:hypothetical protein LBMAG52_36790 [Planctomycetia bacterium]
MNLRTFSLPGGVKCGNCDAVLTRVNRTVTTQGLVMRERVCESCGKLNTTSERVINTRERRRYLHEAAE